MRAVGFRVEVFSSSEEFLHSGHVRNTDCLIVDVRMPGMDGFELQQFLARHQYKIPIIFVTAHGDEDGRLRALKAGAVEYFLKPFGEEALLNAVQVAVNK